MGIGMLERQQPLDLGPRRRALGLVSSFVMLMFAKSSLDLDDAANVFLPLFGHSREWLPREESGFGPRRFHYPPSTPASYFDRTYRQENCTHAVIAQRTHAAAPPDGCQPFDPMMGQLEVIEPGIAMFHGFANVAFAYGRGEMLAADTSSRADGRAGGRGDSRGHRRAVRVPHLYPRPRRSRLRHRGVHHRRAQCAAIGGRKSGRMRMSRPLQALRADRGWQAHINRLQFGVTLATVAGCSTKNRSLPGPDLSRDAVARTRRRAGRAASRDGRDRRRDVGLDAAAARSRWSAT